MLLALRLSPESPAVPLKQPQIAVSKNTIALVYGAGNAIYFASSRDGAKTFSPAVKVAEAKFTPLGMRRGPRVAFSGSAIVVSGIIATERFKDGDLVSWRSTDGGKTWSNAIAITDTPAAAREGLHGLAAGPDGKLLVTWLDLRAGAMKLYGSVSTDAGKTWSANRLIYDSPDGHICECCHPTAYVGKDGRMLVMWRNWLGGSRDMFLASSRDGGNTWQTAAKLGEGTWPLKGCPMDGGGLATDRAGNVHTVWRRKDTVYYAEPGKPETEVSKGKNAMIAAAGSDLYVAWNEGSSLKLKRMRGGEVRTLGEGAFVTLAGTGPMYAAWEDNGAINVQRVDSK